MANTSDLEQALTKEALRIEEDTLYSAKGHFEAAKDWQRWNLWIGVPTTVAAAMAAGTALSNNAVLAGILSAIAAVGSALLTFLNPTEKVNAHLTAGNSYKAVQNQARIFREIDCADPSASSHLSDSLRALAAKRDELNTNSPLIPPRAFERARAGIEAGEASYQVDRNKH